MESLEEHILQLKINRCEKKKTLPSRASSVAGVGSKGVLKHLADSYPKFLANLESISYSYLLIRNLLF